MDREVVTAISRQKSPFIIDYIIADEGLDKLRHSLLELVISSSHRNHYLWLLTLSCLVIPKNLRKQTKAIFVWYPQKA